MNKKSLVVLLVLVLAVSGLFAKESGFKVGGQFGWGFDVGRMKSVDKEDSDTTTLIVKTKNNGFAFNLTGEYDFDKNWGVVANFGMMFAGRSTLVYQIDEKGTFGKSDEKAGLYIDFALDAKYTWAINEKISVAGLAGLELVSGQLIRDADTVLEGSACSDEPRYPDSDLYNVAFGLNLGVEGSYKITDEISIVGGASGAWFFVNSSKTAKDFKDAYEGTDTKASVASFYIRPYVGATYSF